MFDISADSQSCQKAEDGEVMRTVGTSFALHAKLALSDSKQ